MKKVRWETMKENILKKNPEAASLKKRPKSKTIASLNLPIQIVSLKCPILKSQKIKTPVSFRQCDHLSFFDADNFRKSRLSKCPICGKAGTADDLELIELFEDIIKNNPSDDVVKIDAEGNVLPANGMSVNQIAAIKSEPVEIQTGQLTRNVEASAKILPEKALGSRHGPQVTTVGSLMPQRNKPARANRRGKTASEEEAERENIKSTLKKVGNENEKLKAKISLMEKYIGSVMFGREKKNKDLLHQKMKENKGDFRNTLSVRINTFFRTIERGFKIKTREN